MRRVLQSVFLFVALTWSVGLEAQQFRGMEVGQGAMPEDVTDMRALLGNPNVIRYALVIDGADDMDEAAYDAALDNLLLEVDALLPTLAANNMKMILNLHTPPGGFESREAPAQHKLFSAGWAQRAVVESWQAIATRYAGNDTIAAYDLLNEPAERSVAAGLKDWRGILLDIAQAVRVIDPNTLIFFQPKYGNIRYLKIGNVIQGISNSGWSFHLYYPTQFIGQGVNGAPENKHYKKKHRKKLLKLLKSVKKFQKKAKKRLGGLPPIYLGEFSVVRWAPPQEAVNYLNDVIKFSDKAKWHWTFYNWRGVDTWSVEHSSDKNDPNKVSGLTERASVLANAFTKNP